MSLTHLPDPTPPLSASFLIWEDKRAAPALLPGFLLVVFSDEHVCSGLAVPVVFLSRPDVLLCCRCYGLCPSSHPAVPLPRTELQLQMTTPVFLFVRHGFVTKATPPPDMQVRLLLLLMVLLLY